MNNNVDILINKINKNCILELENSLEKNKSFLDRDTFLFAKKMIKNSVEYKFYFPFLLTFFICCVRQKAPKTNTILLSSLFFVIEYFLNCEDEKATKDTRHLSNIANLIIVDELKVESLNKIEFLKKIKKIIASLKKKSKSDLEITDRYIKIKISDHIKNIIDFISLLFNLKQDEINKFRIYTDNISRLIYFNKTMQPVDTFEMQKLQMMKEQAEKVLKKLEPTGEKTLASFSRILLDSIFENSKIQSIAI